MIANKLIKMKTKQLVLLRKEHTSLRKYYYSLWSEVSKQAKNKKIIQKEVSDRMFSNMYQYFLNKKKADKVTYNPMAKEEFSSLKEKREHYSKEAQKLYGEKSILRKYHSETIRQFISKNKLPLPYMEIMSWSEDKFEEWGCKTFEEEPGLVSKIMNFLGK